MILVFGRFEPAFDGRFGDAHDANVVGPAGCRRGAARSSPPLSQAAPWLRPGSGRRRDHAGVRFIVGNIRGGPLADDVGGEQTPNIGKAGQIAQKVAPSPGSAVSSATSAHDVTRQGHAPNPRLLF
jgi:hypothetical protein